MLAAIEAAREEVLVEFYIFTDDSTGKRFAQALTAAAKRGVTCAWATPSTLPTAATFWKQMQATAARSNSSPPLPRPRWRPCATTARSSSSTQGGLQRRNEIATRTLVTLRKKRLARACAHPVASKAGGLGPGGGLARAGSARGGAAGTPPTPNPVGRRARGSTRGPAAANRDAATRAHRAPPRGKRRGGSPTPTSPPAILRAAILPAPRARLERGCGPARPE